tara:strand:- start:113 stop:448 length:336 start_codon:yes stop_codon:yes gene_type:complete
VFIVYVTENETRDKIPDDFELSPIEMLLRPEPVSGIASLNVFKIVFELVLVVTVNAPSNAPADAALDHTVFPLISIPGSLGALECFAIEMLAIVGVIAPLDGAVSSTLIHM